MHKIEIGKDGNFSVWNENFRAEISDFFLFLQNGNYHKFRTLHGGDDWLWSRKRLNYDCQETPFGLMLVFQNFRGIEELVKETLVHLLINCRCQYSKDICCTHENSAGNYCLQAVLMKIRLEIIVRSLNQISLQSLEILNRIFILPFCTYSNLWEFLFLRVVEGQIWARSSKICQLFEKAVSLVISLRHTHLI